MKTPIVVDSASDEFHKVVELIQRIEVALLTTVESNGQFHTRPIQTLGVEGDRSLWFFTDIRSQKASELLQDVRLSLAYADPRSGSYVAIAGTGRVSRDSAKAKRLWSVEQRAYYPGGPRDERLGVLRVAVERAEYWISPGRTSRMIAALKAAITRRPAGIVGRNARIP